MQTWRINDMEEAHLKITGHALPKDAEDDQGSEVLIRPHQNVWLTQKMNSIIYAPDAKRQTPHPKWLFKRLGCTNLNLASLCLQKWKSALRDIRNTCPGASPVAQWLRICLPVQGTRVRALVREDPTCRGATEPVSHNCWACASGACAP